MREYKRAKFRRPYQKFRRRLAENCLSLQMKSKATMQNILAVAACAALLTLPFCIGAPSQPAGGASRRHRDVAGDQAGAMGESAPNDSVSTSTIVISQMLSLSTGQFVAMTRSGRISANNPIRKFCTKQTSSTYILAKQTNRP